MLKIWRSPYSRFGVNVEHPDDLRDETVLAEGTYSDEVLQDIADSDFNAIWVHGQIHHIISNARFPEFAPHSARHLDALRSLCRRAARHGIRVFLYLEPPRAIPIADHAFWNRHMDVAGQECMFTGDDGKAFLCRSLCTSCQPVRDYLRESFAEMTRSLPELAGYIIISASEYPAHCYSCRNCRPGENRPRTQILNHHATSCPRCGRREPEEVVVELLQTIRDGVRSVDEDKLLIFWNWSWTMYLDSPCESIISHLPTDIYLLADFERGGYRADGTYINEYSLGYSGPSEQFLEVSELAESRGIHVMPKFQLGTTHELATVRSLPIIPSLYRKASYVHRHSSPGFMGCWNFGNLSSESLVAFQFFLTLDVSMTEEEALEAFARHQYPECDSGHLISAWKYFAQAMEYYPFCVPFLYNSAVNLALGLIPHPGPLDGSILRRTWLPDERGDSLKESVTDIFPLDDIINRLDKIASNWQQGVALLQQELAHDSREYGNAVICGAVWKSSKNMYEIYRLKLTWTESALPQYRELVRKELELVEEALPYVIADSEQGWHIEGNFYGFNAEMLECKIKALRNSL